MVYLVGWVAWTSQSCQWKFIAQIRRGSFYSVDFFPLSKYVHNKLRGPSLTLNNVLSYLSISIKIITEIYAQVVNNLALKAKPDRLDQKNTQTPLSRNPPKCYIKSVMMPNATFSFFSKRRPYAKKEKKKKKKQIRAIRRPMVSAKQL